MYNHYNYRVTPSVVAFAKGDVTGDRVPDDVYLTGTKSQDSPFIENITLFVKNGRTGARILRSRIFGRPSVDANTYRRLPRQSYWRTRDA